MDLLTDLFRDAGLRRRLLNLRQLPRDRALRFPCDRSVGFHVVLEGAAYLHAPALKEPVRLEAGDIAVMGRGCDHVLAASAHLGALPIERIPLPSEGRESASADDSERSVAAATDGAAATADSLVSGAYQLWHTPVHPFFAELPEWFVLRAEPTARLEPLRLIVAMLANEAQRDDVGRETVVHGLLDVLFTYLMREIIAQRGGNAGAWSHAVRDPQVRAAVVRLHEQSERAWTLDTLAREVGMSRSVLAERFRVAMGTTPLAYLRTVRLQRAMRLLIESTHTLEQVALAVGYQDAFGFSKAFKRAIGQSPGEYRRRDASERDVPWRFRADAAVGRG